MPQPEGIKSTACGRLNGSIGTAVVAGDFALGAGWGGSTLAVTAGSTVGRGEITITCATGGGLAQATATVAFTYPDGAFSTAPFFVGESDNDNSIDTGRFTKVTTTTTVHTVVHSLLPVNTKIYKWRWACVG